MSTRKTTLFYAVLLAIASVAIGMVLASRLDLSPTSSGGYYVACAIGRCNPDDGMRHIWRYLAALMVGLAIVAAVPWISIGFL